MRSIPFTYCLLVSLLHCWTGSLEAEEPNPRSRAEVMWAVSGVKDRDRAHWIRNFDYHQMVPGVASMPMEAREDGFQPEDLRRLAGFCDDAGCRFFFVVELGRLNEQLHAFKEGKHRSFQQHFRQPVTLTAFHKTPGSAQWEKVDPASGTAEEKDMAGNSELEPDQLRRNKNRQRCEFLRTVSAEMAARMVGRVLVEVQGRFESEAGRPDLFAYILTNRSPLHLSAIHVQVPVETPIGKRDVPLLFGGDIGNVGTLEPYGTAASRNEIELKDTWRPKPAGTWVSISGWTQEELDSSRSKRKGRRDPRSDFQEHPDLPPAAHEMAWDTEEGEVKEGN